MRNTVSAETRKYDAASCNVSTSGVSAMPFGAVFGVAGRLSRLGFARGMDWVLRLR
jgi:hypothetical protein